MGFKRRTAADMAKIRRMRAAHNIAAEYSIPEREVYALLERLSEAEVRRLIEERAAKKAA